MAALDTGRLGNESLTKLMSKIEDNLNLPVTKNAKQRTNPTSTKTNGADNQSVPKRPQSARIREIPAKSAGQATQPQKILRTSAHNGDQSFNTRNSSISQAGKKRDARGEVISRPKSAPIVPSASKEVPPSGSDKNELLRNEILALGGTEEDLALIEDVDDDDDEDNRPKLHREEIQPTTRLGKGFKNELSSLIGSLGFGDMPSVSDLEESEEDDTPASSSTAEPVVQKKVAAAPVVRKGFLPEEIQTGFAALKKGRNSGLKVQPRPEWHATPLPVLGEAPAGRAPAPPHVLDAVHKYAKEQLEAENQLYSTSHLNSSSSNKFMSTIMSSGTLSDRVSALTLVAQESPLHTMKTLDNLLGLAKKHSRGQAVYALGSLKDLLGQGPLLPADRRLCSFVKQPELAEALAGTSTWKFGDKLPAGLTDRHLIVWAFEDWLKGYYFQVLGVLETWGKDEIEFARDRSLGYVFELLRDKPEQEANLLRLLVNKLGDPERKIASKASYFLLQLQVSHPLMRGIIASAVESEVLFRPGQSLHAKYYCIITLNQTALSRDEEELANQLLRLYFTLFVSLLTKPKDTIHPGTKARKPVENKKHDRKLPSEADVDLDEQLIERLYSAILTGVNRAFPFSATDDDTLEKHIDTLFTVTHSSNFNTSLQALMLIQRLADSKASIGTRFYRTLYESLLDPRLLTSSKQSLYLNLLYKSLIADTNIGRVKAFIKRLMQIATIHQAPFVCGALFLVAQLQSGSPALRDMCSHVEDTEEDEVEVFHDVPDDGNPAFPREDVTKSSMSARSTSYDPRKRDPEHAHADGASLWEIIPYLPDFHPSISLFASSLLYGDSPPPKPDLAAHTTIAFLDKFIYRNPKASAVPNAPTQRGVSLMQPLYNTSSSSHLLTSTGATAKAAMPMNSIQFLSKSQGQVKEDEVFFHSYFSKVRGDLDRKIKKREKRLEAKQADQGMDLDGDDGSVGDEEEVWKAMVGSAPDIEDDGLDEDENEIGLEDLGDSDEEDPEDDMAADDERGLRGIPNFCEDEDDLISSEEESAPVRKKKRTEGVELLGPITSETREKGGNRRAQRRKLKQLPMFASADDYAEMLRDDADA